MTTSEKIKGGFETSSGVDYFATSPASYNDGQWHYSVVTYDGKYDNLFVNAVKVDENVDRGGWGTEGGACGCTPDQIISWGGPITTFRWDTATDVDFKYLSVREIAPPQ
jgi:hypothetical protein